MKAKDCRFWKEGAHGRCTACAYNGETGSGECRVGRRETYVPQTGAEVFKAPPDNPKPAGETLVLGPMIDRELEILRRHGLLPTDAQARKAVPMHRGLLKYFPKALAAVAELSQAAMVQHGLKELGWDRTKSMDHGDCIVRHQVDAGALDTDGKRHSTKVAWRALAQLEIELEEAEASK